ncbi:hypothetical protein IAR50_004593 [Cryptococcus sp. DSM 104548]
MSQQSVPKAILYSWPSSVWSTGSASSRRATPKTSTSSSMLTYVSHPVFLWLTLTLPSHWRGKSPAPANPSTDTQIRISARRISSTIPTLVVPTLETTGTDVDTRYRSLRDTVSICDFLDQSRSVNTSQTSSERPAPALAPATIQAKSLSDQIVELIHLPAVDPNFIAISAADETELKEKAAAAPGKALTARKEALKKYLAEARQAVANSSVIPKEGSTTFDQRVVLFLEEKLKTNEEIWKIYYGETTPEALEQFYEVSRNAWRERLPEVFAQLETLIRGPFILGDHLSLADLHAISWLTRIVSIAGGQPDAEGLFSIETKTGANLGEKTKKFWESWIERESFQQVLVPASTAFEQMK